MIKYLNVSFSEYWSSVHKGFKSVMAMRGVVWPALHSLMTNTLPLPALSSFTVSQNPLHSVIEIGWAEISWDTNPSPVSSSPFTLVECSATQTMTTYPILN